MEIINFMNFSLTSPFYFVLVPEAPTYSTEILGNRYALFKISIEQRKQNGLIIGHKYFFNNTEGIYHYF